MGFLINFEEILPKQIEVCFLFGKPWHLNNLFPLHLDAIEWKERLELIKLSVFYFGNGDIENMFKILSFSVAGLNLFFSKYEFDV